MRLRLSWIACPPLVALLVMPACVGDAPLTTADAGGGDSGGDSPIGSEGGADAPADGATNPSWTWTTPSPLSLSAVVLDTTGNVYVAGGLSGAFSADGQTIASTKNRDIFVAKLDPNARKVLWAVAYAGDNDEAATAIAFDASALFITGYTTSPHITFPGAQPSSDVAPILGSSATKHSFVAKLDAANGQPVWATSFDTTRPPNQVHDSSCNAISAKGGQIAVGCSYSGPGFAFPFNNAINCASTAALSDGMCIALLTDASTPGANWFKAYGSGTNDAVNAVLFNGTAVYVAGSFGGPGTFTDKTTAALIASGNGNSNAIVFGINAITPNTSIPGNVISATGQAAFITSLASPTLTTFIIGGGYTGTPQIGGSGPAFPNLGGTDAFVVELSGLTSVAHVATFGGNGDDVVQGVAAASSDKFVTGQYGSANAKFGQDSFPSPPAGYAGAFIGHLDSTATPTASVSVVGATASVLGRGVAYDPSSQVVYSVGDFTGAVTFDDGTAATSALAGSAFVMRRSL